MSEFERRVALVTGGGSGIGRATAVRFAELGAGVAVVDRSQEDGESTVEAISSRGGHARFFPSDVSDSTAIRGAVDASVAEFGRLDCAHNNAGVEGPNLPIVDYPVDAWLDVLQVNLTGVWLSMKFEIPHLLASGGGVIVNTASIDGLVGETGISGYAASKHGVVGLTKVVALEYAKRGIRVNAVCPGYTATPMIRRILGDPDDLVAAGRFEQFERLHPMGRIGAAEEIAAAVVWLCSSEASFITGATLAIDGAYTAQ